MLNWSLQARVRLDSTKGLLSVFAHAKGTLAGEVSATTKEGQPCSVQMGWQGSSGARAEIFADTLTFVVLQCP